MRVSLRRRRLRSTTETSKEASALLCWLVIFARDENVIHIVSKEVISLLDWYILLGDRVVSVVLIQFQCSHRLMCLQNLLL